MRPPGQLLRLASGKEFIGAKSSSVWEKSPPATPTSPAPFFLSTSPDSDTHCVPRDPRSPITTPAPSATPAPSMICMNMYAYLH